MEHNSAKLNFCNVAHRLQISYPLPNLQINQPLPNHESQQKMAKMQKIVQLNLIENPQTNTTQDHIHLVL